MGVSEAGMTLYFGGDAFDCICEKAIWKTWHKIPPQER